MNKIIPLILMASTLILCAAPLFAEGPAKAPDIITLDSLSEQYQPVFFTHERHTSYAGNCGTCHHEHGNSGTLPCKNCHSLNAAAFKNSVTHSFMACKNCHGSYSPSSVKTPGLKAAYHTQCLQCHRGMGTIGKDPKGCAELCHARKELTLSKKLK